MKIKSLNHRDIEILAASCLLLASKFDEIDYNLPSFEYMKNTERLKLFWEGLEHQEFVHFEKFIVQSLDWQFYQLTPYHFLQALLSQGIVLSHERVMSESSEEELCLGQSDNTQNTSKYA